MHRDCTALNAPRTPFNGTPSAASGVQGIIPCPLPAMKILHLQNSLSSLLSPLGAAYGMAMSVRRNLWERDLFERFVPTCPCVSVGNICWGGTGKTPLVDWLMGNALQRGERPVVLTRGYKASPSVLPLHVNPMHTPAEAGDEPLMLALRHPDAVVLVDPDRRRAAEEALRSMKPDLFILDDGMQHVAIARHLELVALRPQDLADQWNCVIPQGSWREGVQALSRAHAFFLKTDPETFWKLTPLIKHRLLELGKPVFSFQLSPTALVRLDGTGRAMPKDLGGRPYGLVTGVGNPEQVRETATRFMGYAPAEHLAFKDHHDYTFKDVRSMEQRGLPVLCTTKDAVKLRRMPMSQLWCIHTEVVFGPSLWSRVPFPDWWGNWMNAATQAMAESHPSVPLPEGYDPEAALDGDDENGPVRRKKPASQNKNQHAQASEQIRQLDQTGQTVQPNQHAPHTPQSAEALRFATPPRPGSGLPDQKPATKTRAWDNDSQRPTRPTTPGLPGGRKSS